MAKKNKPEAPTSSNTPAPPAQAEAAKDADVVRVEHAFAVGNYAAVRRVAAGAASPARDTAAALMPRMVVESVQVAVGLAALVVVLTVCALTLH